MDPQQNSNPSNQPHDQDNPASSDDIITRPAPSFSPRTSGGSLPVTHVSDFSPPSVIPPQQSVPSWTPQAIANGNGQSASPVPAPPVPSGNNSLVSPNKPKKKLFIGLGAALAVIALSLGTVFGYYLPNKPENVYKTGLSRSGEVLGKLVTQSTEKDKLQQVKKAELDGLLEVSSNLGGDFNGTFNVKLDPTKSDGHLDFKMKDPDQGQGDQTLGLKFLTDLQKDKRFIDLYFQLTGLKTLGVDAFVPGITDYDGKWIAVEAEYLESLSGEFIPPAEQKNKENISSEEVAQLIRAISDVSNEYLFTADPDKAVFENREYLGKEKTEEGINAFHYKVGVNAAHSVAYCKALSEKILPQPAVRKIANADDKQIEDYKKSAIEDCDNSSKDIKPDETFEMWIDAKYKVIHKVRFYSEKDKKDEYTDVGQIYTGGDKLALFTKYHQDKDNLNVKFTLDVDIKANNSKAELTAKQEGDSGFSGKASLSAKPYDGEINATKPPGAIPIKDILTRFGYDPTYLSGIENDGSGTPGASGLQSNSRNTQRKNDVSSVAAALTEYVANNNGNVPTTSAVFNAQVMNNAKTDIYKTANVKYTINPGGTQSAPPDTSGLFIMTNMKCDQTGTQGVVTGATKRTFIALYRVEGGASANGTAICQEL